MTASIQERREIAERLNASIGEGLLGLYSAVLGDDAKNRTAALYKRLADLIDPGEDVSVDAYDLLPDDEHEYLWWAKSVGGVDAVYRQYRAADNRRVELCAALGIDADTGWSDAMAEMVKRLMPEGMEGLVDAWPRFEDGEPVRIGDDFEDLGQVAGIKFGAGGVTIEGTAGNSDLFITSDERVKRTAPKVLDADGEPLEVGQTVWHVGNGVEFTVIGLPRSDEYQAVKLQLCDGAVTGLDPDQLTHTKPEPDTWDRINEESQLFICEYFDHMNGSCHDCPGGPPDRCRANMMADVVNRCKTLAEGEQS